MHQRPSMIAEFPIVIIKHINGQKMIPENSLRESKFDNHARKTALM